MIRAAVAAALTSVALLAFTSGDAMAQLKRGRARGAQTKECLDCHKAEAKEYGSRRSRHAPVQQGSCESCHMKHGVVGVLRLAAEDPSLCLSCHAMQGVEGTGKGLGEKGAPAKGSHLFTHPPREALKCGTCHDPHGSENSRLLKASSTGSCLGCHDAAAHEGVSKHAPAAADCLSCHDPHGSALPAHLARAGEALCTSCHDGGSAGEKAGHGGGRPPGSTCLDCHTPHASAEAGLLRRHVHAPMAEGEGFCGTCHTASGQAPFGLVAQGADLCITCHEDPRAPTASAGSGLRVHVPVADGDCVDCHSPHASDETGLLKASQPDLCGSCHAESQKARDAKAPHEPARGECSACHLPHAGPAGLLKASAPALCETCHAQVAEQTARPVPHPPATEGACLTCHDPHGSDHAGSLAEAPAALCGSCHEDLTRQMQARVRHAPAREGNCAACHEPHGSTSASLLVSDLAKACLSCHGEEAGRADLKGHAPFESGDCLACHRPHASTRDRLLVADAGTLCLDCHGDVAEASASSTLHLPVRRGQCLSCHAPHQGHGQALLLRKEDRTLCLSCHVEVGREMSRQDRKAHAPFQSESCLTCHAAHASEHVPLLADAAASLCLTCHDPATPAVKVAHKGLITSTTDCTGCHAGHASERDALLLGDLHAPFAEGECSACHQAVTP